MRQLSELQAFTSAVLGGESDLDKIVDAAAEAKNLADEAQNFEERVKTLLPDGQLSNAAFAAGVLVASATAVGAIGYAISNRLDYIADERAQFWEMVQHNSVAFLVLESESDRNPYGNYVAEFIRQLKAKPTLYALSGLKRKTVDTEDAKGNLFIASCIPLMPFIARVAQPSEDGDFIDESLQFLMFLLDSELVLLLEKVRSHVKDKFFNNASMFFKGRDHVQWVNSTSIVAVLIANISLAIGLGVKPNSNTLYTLSSLKQICQEFRALLLNTQGDLNQVFKKNSQTLCESEHLDRLILKLTDRINRLEIAYSKKLQNDLNLGDVVSSGYALLQNTTRPIRRLLYGDRLENPAKFFRDLIDLKVELEIYPKLLTRLVKKLNFRDFDAGLLEINGEPTTVMDLLIVYANSFRGNRETALNRFSRPEDANFRDILRKFDEEYIQPIEDSAAKGASKGKGLTSGLWSKSQPINPAAEFLICFTSLMIEAHNVSLLDGKGQVKSSNQQAAAFLKKAFDDSSRYRFSYFFNKNVFNLKWKEYLQTQKNLLFGVRHLSLITTLTNTNQRYLQRAEFQEFLLRSIARLKEAKEQFLQKKNTLTHNGQQLSQQNNFEGIIVAEINETVPQKHTRLDDLLSVFAKSLNLEEQILRQSKFDENAMETECNLIDFAESYHLMDPQELEEWQKDTRFYQALRDHVLAGQLVEDNNPPVYDILVRNRSNSISSVNSDTDNAHFRLRAYDIMFVTSIALLAIGITTLLLFSFAASSFAFLSAEVISGFIIAGFAVTGAGSVGIASSYLVPRFFDQKSELIPVLHDDALKNEFVH